MHTERGAHFKTLVEIENRHHFLSSYHIYVRSVQAMAKILKIGRSCRAYSFSLFITLFAPNLMEYNERRKRVESGLRGRLCGRDRGSMNRLFLKFVVSKENL